MQQQLVHYQIKDLLGEGSFASVYRAFDQKFERDVALKILKPVWLGDPEAVGRFKREAKTMAQLRHPHIVDVYDVGEAEGYIYLAQLLVDGETLTARLRRGPLAWAEMLEVLRSMASALDYAHGRGIVHRDVKPSNIMVARDGRAYLGDFGLVRAAEGSVVLSTSSGGMIGTPAYMAPEQWEGQGATAVTDVYALSCVVVEMLTGQVLFDGTTPATVMRQHLLEGPKLPAAWPAGVPEQVTPVLQRGLADNPAERISSAGELARAVEAPATLPPPAIQAEKERSAEIESTLVSQPAPGSPPAPSVPVSRTAPAPQRRSSVGLVVALVGIGGLLALIVCAVLAYFLWGPIGDGTLDKTATAQAMATAQAVATQTAIAQAQMDDEAAATAQAATATAQALATVQSAATETAMAQEDDDAAATAQAATVTAQALATEQAAATETAIAQMDDEAAATAQAATATAQALATEQKGATETIIAATDAAATALAATATAIFIDNPPIEVGADETTINEEECTDLHWNIQHVAEVYLINDNSRKDNEGSQQVCPTTTTIYRWRIVKLNGNEVEPEVTITVIPKPPTPDLLTTHSPALATFKNKLFLAFRTSNNEVWIANYDGTEWEVHGAISGIVSDQGPALAAFNNRLYLTAAFIEHGLNDPAWLTSSPDGSTWPDDHGRRSATERTPALTVFNNSLYQVTKGHNNDLVWVTNSLNDSSWRGHYSIPGVWTSHGPALAVFNNRLYLATRGHNNESVWVTSSADGSTWLDDYAVSGVRTSHGPALAVFNNRLYLATKGHNNQYVWVTSSTNGSTWPDDYAVSGVETSENPAFAVFNGRLYLAFKGYKNDHIWLTSTADGSRWTGPGQVP